MRWHYVLALAVDCIGILVALYFLFSDYLKYPGTHSNGTLGMVTLVFCCWVGISYYLYHHGRPGIASAMAWVPAVPLLGYGVFILLFILLKPDMR